MNTEQLNHPENNDNSDSAEIQVEMDVFEKYAFIVSGLTFKEYLQKLQDDCRLKQIREMLMQYLNNPSDYVDRFLIEYEFGKALLLKGYDAMVQIAFIRELILNKKTNCSDLYIKELNKINRVEPTADCDKNEYYLKLLKTGETPASNETQKSFKYFDIEFKKRLLTMPENDIKFALPSYVIWKMFRDGKLAQYGIDDNTFLKISKFNEWSKYFNFAYIEGNEIKISKITLNPDFISAAANEIASITTELIPIINCAVEQKNLNMGMGLTNCSLCSILKAPDGSIKSLLPEALHYNELLSNQ
ncbi:hypothetical protein JW911_04390 [Candidatus Peregrinibacteria bacterium]|nr:hypothetical protein [Candidatus Peregrinibacteria bacterium]